MPDDPLSRCSNARAVAAGLACRPVADTARDTLAWWRAQPEERRARLKAGLTAAREAEVLAAWHARAAG
jgi:2'-hydroxyisoflavone reductase